MKAVPPRHPMREQPRLLARQAGHAHPEQYTASSSAALANEPEAVSEAEQERQTFEAKRRAQVLRAEELERQATRTMVNRLREAKVRARRLGIDVSGADSIINQQISDMERQCQQAA